MTPSHSPTPVINAVQTTSLTTDQQYTTIHKSNAGRQRSIYELAGEVVNYEHVASPPKSINLCSTKEALTDNSLNPMFTKEGNGDVVYGIVRKGQNRNHIESNEDANAETEEGQPRVISMFPPVAKVTGRKDCTNCAGDVTKKAKVARNMLENNGTSLSDIVEEDDWEQSNEVVLVDNELYSGK